MSRDDSKCIQRLLAKGEVQNFLKTIVEINKRQILQKKITKNGQNTFSEKLDALRRMVLQQVNEQK